MKTYRIQRIHSQPDWSAVPVLQIDHPYLETTQDIRAYAQLCYGAEALFVHLWAEELQIRAVEKGALGMPCEDSCLEFFFCPIEGDPRYLNLEFNPNGCFYLGIGSCVDDLTRLVPDEADQVFKPNIHRSAAGWEIFYQIPYRFILRFFPNFDAAPGTTIRANCYKCSDLSVPPHYLSWSPIQGTPFTFHRPDSFGFMIFSNDEKGEIQQ
ncbi:MAG: carbohydrate-binding family 9-like protein [Oscillospiraceae bacterium]|nr:carbohydrate-binding family 9-like protein [Oscillospiraceae bacterium]